jgi:type VI secretion system protein ImpC
MMSDNPRAKAVTTSRGASTLIEARMTQIDSLISIQLNEILHHPEFQRLEASWRDLKYLVDQGETRPTLKLKVLNASKQELLGDLLGAQEFQESTLFRKVYEEVYGVLGGEPFAAMIGKLRVRGRGRRY